MAYPDRLPLAPGGGDPEGSHANVEVANCHIIDAGRVGGGREDGTRFWSEGPRQGQRAIVGVGGVAAGGGCGELAGRELAGAQCR